VLNCIVLCIVQYCTIVLYNTVLYFTLPFGMPPGGGGHVHVHCHLLVLYSSTVRDCTLIRYCNVTIHLWLPPLPRPGVCLQVAAATSTVHRRVLVLALRGGVLSHRPHPPEVAIYFCTIAMVAAFAGLSIVRSYVIRSVYMQHTTILYCTCYVQYV